MILAFDTSSAACRFALCLDGRIVAVRGAELRRDMAERLFDELGLVLADGGCDWRDLTGVAVCVGPGGFTGLRVGVSAARGLALGLGVRAVGVGLDDVSGDCVASAVGVLGEQLLNSGRDLPLPAPLYLKGANAALPRDVAPVILP